MKDTLITGKRKKIELLTLIACFVIACVVNIYAIVRFNTPWSETITSLGYVFVFSVALYVAWSIVRLVYYLIKKSFRNKKRR
ncbi:MAG: hypothetical protein LBJ72_09325 [Dysgonamonadaceae bacterium]|jgi:hypothetical protein|nr:hypothetical protein [Dysgonamonadaceae bacterium]